MFKISHKQLKATRTETKKADKSRFIGPFQAKSRHDGRLANRRVPGVCERTKRVNLMLEVYIAGKSWNLTFVGGQSW